LDTSIKKTRGAVGAVAVFDKKERKWKICGVGNIQTRFCNPMLVKNHMSYNGIIGMNVPRTLNTQEINHEKGQLLIMCSDGLKTKWDVLQYPAIWRYDPSILAAVLIKDFGRFTDDTSVAVCKIIM
jgi:hypothetical protein